MISALCAPSEASTAEGGGIINKSGIENVGYGSETRKKKFTKLTVLANDQANMIAVIPHKTNKKTIKFDNNEKEYVIQTIEHDIKGIIPIIESLQTDKKIILTGDTGYVINDNKKTELNDKYNTKLITSYRRNQKKKNTEEEKKILKSRPKVENAISKLKRFNRIHVRRDKLMASFMGFVHIGYMCVQK